MVSIDYCYRVSEMHLKKGFLAYTKVNMKVLLLPTSFKKMCCRTPAEYLRTYTILILGFVAGEECGYLQMSLA